ncbi:MAG: Holliday junction resolvase RuvX [Nitrospirota bacterium]
MARILALDPGEKRIGLAVSDELGWTAQGLPTLPRRGMTDMLAHLSRLVTDYQVHEIVVGVPYRQDGTLGLSGERALALIERLAHHFQLPVTPWDERLTTRMAERLLIEGGVSRAKRKLSRDRLAAVLILQSYLDARRPT